jgi:GTP-binding protein HflX
VVDAADPHWREQLQVVRDTLATVGAARLPALVLLNKIDRVADPDARATLAAEQPEAIPISALDPGDAALLHARIAAFFEGRMTDGQLHLPPARAGLLGEIHAQARVLQERHRPDGVHLRLRAFPRALQRWRALVAA